MSSPVNTVAPIPIYSANLQYSQHVQLQLDQHPLAAEFKTHIAETLESEPLNHPPHPVIVLGLSPATGSDIRLEFLALMRWLTHYRQQQKQTQVLLLTTKVLSPDQCCQAVKAGIYSVLDFNFSSNADLLSERILSALQRHDDLQLKRNAPMPSSRTSEKSILGSSQAMKQIADQAHRASQVSDVPVLISGESGTGKQRLAEFVHQNDQKRNTCPFVSVNCAAISGSLAESELFGHQKGAFTGATDSRPGYFRSADGGTILLDEVGELDLMLQPKILRILQESLVRPVGSDQEHKIDVRVIAATNLDLPDLVEQGKFRLDLYQRLNVISMTMPPLRQRLSDIPYLFTSFLAKYAHYYSGDISRVDPHVYDILAGSIGSGNIRELENAVRQILVFKEQGNSIEISDLPKALLDAPTQNICKGIQVSEPLVDALAQGTKALHEALDDYEKALLNNLMTRKIQRSKLANRLGVTRRTLYNKLQKHDLL